MHALVASASPLVRRYTLDEFFALEPPPEGGHYELIAGVLYMVPPPKLPHSLVVSRLNMVLAAYAAAHPDACTLFVPSAPVWTLADTYLVPDLFLLSPERLRAMGELRSADLVVEVLSPSTAVYDRTAKADTYAALGVAELWLVDIEKRTIEQRGLVVGAGQVVRTRSGADAVESARFPGLSAVPDAIFAAPAG